MDFTSKFIECAPWNYNFNKSLNWQEERFFTARPEWDKALERGGCWVDYATVHYWYQTTPGGFEHAKLRPFADRQKPMRRCSVPPGPVPGETRFGN